MLFHKNSMLLAMFITSEGFYYFKRLPFGVSPAPGHSQKRIPQLIDSIDAVLCHADDILVTGKDHAEHDDRLYRVLQKFGEAGLTLKDRCQFAITGIRFLGHIINSQRHQSRPG